MTLQELDDFLRTNTESEQWHLEHPGKKGELLIQFDRTELEKKRYNCTCMIVCTSGEPKAIVTAGEVRKGETLFSC